MFFFLFFHSAVFAAFFAHKWPKESKKSSNWHRRLSSFIMCVCVLQWMSGRRCWRRLRGSWWTFWTARRERLTSRFRPFHTESHRSWVRPARMTQKLPSMPCYCVSPAAINNPETLQWSWLCSGWVFDASLFSEDICRKCFPSFFLFLRTNVLLREWNQITLTLLNLVLLLLPPLLPPPL